MRSLKYPELKHIFHIVVKSDGSAACTIADETYPAQSGLSCSLGLLKQPYNVVDLKAELKRVQDPAQADKFNSIFYIFFFYFCPLIFIFAQDPEGATGDRCGEGSYD